MGKIWVSKWALKTQLDLNNAPSDVVACAIVGFNKNGIKRACDALFRASLDMTSLSWLFLK